MVNAAETAPIVDRIDPYAEWRQREGVPMPGGVYVQNMKTVEVGDWPRKGVKGALMYLDGDDELDEHIVEIPPGGATNPDHHIYEETIYVLTGRGTCAIWYDESRKQTFEWGEGSFFALPTNVNYQFFNGSGSQPARYFSVTNLPKVMRQFHNEDFIFHNSFAFTDRYGGEVDYFNRDGKLYHGRLWETNFVPDVRKLKLWEWKERGGGGTNAFFALAGGRINSHISRFQPATYKKAHRHNSGAHLYICEGEGFGIIQRSEREARVRCDWQEGSLYLPGAGEGRWLHQHFNVGATPATYLVLHADVQSRRYATSRWGFNDQTEQIEYEDEDPEIHRIFEEELAKRGVTCRMKNLVPWCTGVEGPTQKGEWGDEQ